MAKRLLFVLLETCCTVEDGEDLRAILDELEDTELTKKEMLPAIVGVQLGEVDKDGNLKRITHTTLYDGPLMEAILFASKNLPKVQGIEREDADGR